jgi:2-polyprenyl-3-methyl-5-hydroxy-6-metoxy-1,4-benzoquinol methylase
MAHPLSDVCIEPGQAMSTQSTHWSDTGDDPNSIHMLSDRAARLAAAWRPSIEDRTLFITDRVAGKRVLDIGCVAHDEARMASQYWLHAHVARAAASCIGVDVLDEGVAAMNAKGFSAVVHDLSSGLGPLANEAPFQVMVAGELIEHVGSLDMLFATAAEGLSADGELIITTPNPYAPHRVRAGQRGLVWENVDHILYAFPSGISELASRHGLVLAEAMTTTPSRRPRIGALRWMKRTLKRSRWHRQGFDSRAKNRSVVLDRLDPFDAILHRLRPNAPFVGETFIYVVTRGPLK